MGILRPGLDLYDSLSAMLARKYPTGGQSDLQFISGTSGDWDVTIERLVETTGANTSAEWFLLILKDSKNNRIAYIEARLDGSVKSYVNETDPADPKTMVGSVNEKIDVNLADILEGFKDFYTGPSSAIQTTRRRISDIFI